MAAVLPFTPQLITLSSNPHSVDLCCSSWIWRLRKAVFRRRFSPTGLFSRAEDGRNVGDVSVSLLGKLSITLLSGNGGAKFRKNY